MRVNGLYGHVRRNDTRSLVLFAGFVAAFHMLALLGLLLPLAMLDAAHAPLTSPGGYLVRWVPLVSLLGAVLFAVQMRWHVRYVRVKTAFRFVDGEDELRLCRIVEPLVIAAGLPTPYVAVIDSPALNAFACGIRRKEAVLVFTRGLIDGLDDEELAAVAAHEISHIVNGDIRLIAAANVCLSSLRLVTPRESMAKNRLGNAIAMPVLIFVMPALFALTLAICLVRRLAVDASHLTRLLIASSREFVADAEAVRLTQNPAALIAALRAIEGRSAIPALAAGQDAMMIDGAHEGAMATHPTIDERVRAIVSVTGTMALVAPSRRDTREAGATGGFGRRRAATVVERPAVLTKVRALTRVRGADGLNRLGMTTEMTIGAVIGLVAFGAVHAADLGKPRALAAAFDPAPMNLFLGIAGQGARCEIGGIAGLLAGGHSATPAACRPSSLQPSLAAHDKEWNLIGAMARGAQPAAGEYEYPDGTFSNVPPPDVQLAEVRARRCFQTGSYSVGDGGLHSVLERPDDRQGVSLPMYLKSVDSAAFDVRIASAGGEDRALRDYFQARKDVTQLIHRSYGRPGLVAARATFAGADHRHAVALLAERLRDARFAAATLALELAEMHVLVADPGDFVSCIARGEHATS